MKRRLFLGITIAVLMGAQLYPAERSNPRATAVVDAPPEIRSLLERSCFDCHSNDTRWPWYSRIAPASWLVTHDVHEGRAALNFSEWDLYDEEEQTDLVDLVGELARNGDMPPWFYLPLHPGARLDEDQVRLLEGWSETFEPSVR